MKLNHVYIAKQFKMIELTKEERRAQFEYEKYRTNRIKSSANPNNKLGKSVLSEINEDLFKMTFDEYDEKNKLSFKYKYGSHLPRAKEYAFFKSIEDAKSFFKNNCVEIEGDQDNEYMILIYTGCDSTYVNLDSGVALVYKYDKVIKKYVEFISEEALTECEDIEYVIPGSHIGGYIGRKFGLTRYGKDENGETKESYRVKKDKNSDTVDYIGDYVYAVRTIKIRDNINKYTISSARASLERLQFTDSRWKGKSVDEYLRYLEETQGVYECFYYTVAYMTSLEEADEILKGRSDLSDDGWYNYAVIEKINMNQADIDNNIEETFYYAIDYVDSTFLPFKLDNSKASACLKEYKKFDA